MTADVENFADHPAEPADLLPCLRDIATDEARDFDLGLQKLGFYLISKDRPSLFQKLRNIGGELS